MTLKPISLAALLVVPLAGATAQAPQASDHGSDGHRGWFVTAAGALTSAAVFSSMIHSDAPGTAQREMHLPTPTSGGALNLPGNSGNTPAADRPTHPDHPDHPDTPGGDVIGGDDDDVTTTPEPGTAALLATGLVGLAGMVRRRPRV